MVTLEPSPIEKAWKPLKKQKEFIELPFSIFEALYGGAAGAGKSEILLLLPLLYRFHEHPLFKGIVLRRTFPELESEIILRSKEWYSHCGAVYNESKRRWTFRSGAVMQFGHAEREDDVRKYDTAQFNYIGWDESTSFTEFQYKYLSFSRCRSRTSDLPAIVRAATNPGNVGHSFFRDRFVTPAKLGSKLIVDKSGLKRYFVHATVYDNPILLRDNPLYVQQLESLPEAERKAKLGDWWTFEGQVFKEFRLEPLVGEPENARHVIDEFDIPLWWPRVIAIDWGYSAFCWIGWFAISPDGRIYLYREYCEKRQEHDDWISEMINLTGDERISVQNVWICHSANQNRGEPETIKNKVYNAIKANKFEGVVQLGTRGRVNGKLNVHNYLRWEPKKPIASYYKEPFNAEKAQQLFKLYGEKAYLQYINIYTEKEDTSPIPKLQIFSHCKHIIDVLPKCVYDEHNCEDVKEFDGDDPYDGLRIGLDGINDYVIKHAADLAEMKKSDDAVKELAKGDQTAFYRKMEFIESKSKKIGSFRRRVFGRSRVMQRM